MTQNIKQHLHNMYIGLVCVHWADKENVKMGTAKQKSLQQMQSYSQTLDKKNPVAQEITAHVNNMVRSVSKQIMIDTSSEMVLDKESAPKYKKFGEQQIALSKKQLNAMIERGQKSGTRDITFAKIKETKEKSEKQDMLAKQKAPQYRPSTTNVAEKGKKPAMTLQKLDQQELLKFLAQQQYQKAA